MVVNVVITSGRNSTKASEFFTQAVVPLAFLLGLLGWIRFQPVLPDIDLDTSWRWAVDYASLHHVQFGNDFVFTFGPLGFIYAGLRLPEHDFLYIILTSLFYSGLFSGFVLTASKGRRAYLLLLPILLSNLAVRDGSLFIVPLALVLASSRAALTPTWAAGITLVAIADGLLPLIKGTVTVPVAFCTALSCVILYRDHLRWALVLPVVTAATGLLAWIGCGQAVENLPVYLLNQSQIARGYTEAMSVWGNVVDLLVYVPVSLVLAFLAYRAPPAHHTVRALAVIGVAGIVFKAAFVRHDGHGFIAGSSLGLIGLLVFLHDDAKRAFMGLFVGLLAWYVIAGTYVPANPKTVLTTFAQAVSESISAIDTRLRDPTELFKAFKAKKAALAQAVGLPALVGSVDVYPTDIGAVLASDLDWRPRPVIQSYSAYTPALAAMNARHLEGPDAPETVLFNVGPVDNRYPNLEDGASWLGLLSHYSPHGMVGPYAMLRRTTTDHHASVGQEVLGGTFSFDARISIPPTVPNVWATFHFHPLKTGRLLSLVFKRPTLYLDVDFASGDHERFRMIPGMAEGFLLSPAIRSANDFLMLAADDEDGLKDAVVRSISLHQDSTYPFLGTTFDLVLAPLEFQQHDDGEP